MKSLLHTAVENNATSFNKSTDSKNQQQTPIKDAEHELFNVTLMAQVLSHKDHQLLIEMASEDADKLFYEVKKQGIPFLTWNDWIRNHIEVTLARY